MEILYECCICGRFVENAMEVEDSRGNLVFLCTQDHFAIEFKDDDE